MLKLRAEAVLGTVSADIPPYYVVGLDILRPGELPKDDLVAFSDDFFFLHVVLSENTQHVRHFG